MHIHYHYPRPEPFSPYPPGGQVPDYAKWMKEQLALKQDKLTFDILPVEGSLNPVTSGGIYLALAAKASLVNGKVPAEQLPSYVDDVLEFASREAFPNPGEGGILYVAKDQNLVYRWTGTTYVAVVSRIDIDTMVTRLSSNPVASLGIWAAIWGSLNTTPTGYTSLYDWTLGTRASKTDTTLTDRYSDWVISFQLTDEQKESFRQYGPEEAAENDFALTIRNGTTLYVGNYNAAAGSPSEDGFSLLLEGGDARLGLQEGDTIATRTLIGYQLGSQTDKPLQPQGDYLTKDEVVEPSSTAVAGQAADAKATYEQLDAKLDKSGGTMTGGLTIKNAALSLIPQRLNEGTSVVMQGETVDVTTPDPVTQTFNHRTVTWPSATGTLAITADATLTPVYSDTPTYTDWVCDPAVPTDPGGNPLTINSITYQLGYWVLNTTPYGNIDATPGSETDTTVVFSNIGYHTQVITATRTRTDILGYVLGSQTGKQLQPKGDYAPATKTVTVAATKTMLPPDCFPIRYTDGGAIVELSADDVEFTSQFVLRVKGATPVIALATFALPSGGQTIADYSQHPDITFGGRAPTTGVWPAYLREGETYSVTYPVVYGNDIAPLAPLASPAFTGTPTAPTPASGDDSTKVATTAFVQDALGGITPGPDNTKLDSVSAAPAFDATTTYPADKRVTYNGKLYKCIVAVTTPGAWTGDTNWEADTMTDPDATVDITNIGQLRIVDNAGTVLWAQGYDLASASAVALNNEAVNLFTFTATTATAFSDASAYAVGDRVIYNGAVYKFTEAHAAGAWIGTDATEDPDTQAFALPSTPTGKVGDFILDLDNTANADVGVAVTLTGLDSTFSIVVPEGEALADILSVGAGEMAELYFTMTAFRVNDKPTWKVVKQVVENGGAQA